MDTVTDKIKASTLRKEPATWGDEFRTAYARAKRYYPGEITYELLAERVSRLVPTNHTTILRLGYLDDPPSTPSQRQVAYLALRAMNYDPREFGLSHEDRALRGMSEKDISKVLAPKE